ncbi:hypothetical protein PAXRUDRAFT_777397, partial [Paxillus rubicundulus Ve08.2h10]
MNSFMSANVDPESPILCQILGATMQMEWWVKENKIKDGSTACHAVVTQLAKQRSNQSNYFTAPFMLSLWTSGASCQTIEALPRCGLCISFLSLLNLINNLAKHCMECASQIAQGLHLMCYDNINISTSIFVEQRSSAPAKVQLGPLPSSTKFIAEALNKCALPQCFSELKTRLIFISILTYAPHPIS